MNIENMIRNDIEKGIRAVENEKKRSVRCKCGCVVRFRDFNIFGWGVCPRCGRKVMKPIDAFKDKLYRTMKGEK